MGGEAARGEMRSKDMGMGGGRWHQGSGKLQEAM